LFANAGLSNVTAEKFNAHSKNEETILYLNTMIGIFKAILAQEGSTKIRSIEDLENRAAGLMQESALRSFDVDMYIVIGQRVT
jgi:hypothetical protein